MTDFSKAGTYSLGDRSVKRIGYGAMQLAGPGVFGPPKDHGAALAVLRAAIENGVDHIDTSDFYGPHVTNRIIREALHPYADGLTIVTKVGAVRGTDGSWNPAQGAAELTSAVHDNLRNLGLDRLDVVNLRAMGGGAGHGPSEGSIEPQLTALIVHARSELCDIIVNVFELRLKLGVLGDKAFHCFPLPGAHSGDVLLEKGLRRAEDRILRDSRCSAVSLKSRRS